MKKHKSGSVWMILPLYIFTIIFVAGPLLYMVALSFAQPKAGHGVEWVFTLANYKKILDPVYMKTFTGSFQLAVTSTIIICMIGYPYLVQLSGNRDRYDLCASSIYDPVCIFQRRKIGLVTGGSCERSGGEPGESFLDGFF